MDEANPYQSPQSGADPLPDDVPPPPIPGQVAMILIPGSIIAPMAIWSAFCLARSLFFGYAWTDTFSDMELRTYWANGLPVALVLGFLSPPLVGFGVRYSYDRACARANSNRQLRAKLHDANLPHRRGR